MEEDIVSPSNFDPFGSKFCPQGICKDALSHILVIEKDTVQLIDVDGNFLSVPSSEKATRDILSIQSEL